MEALTKNDYLPEELFSQKGCTAKDAKIDKTLVANLSRQARHPMLVVSADAAYCYDRVNHIVVSLVWLVLTRNTPAIVEVLSTYRLWRFEILLWRPVPWALHDGTGTGKPCRSTIMDTSECCFGQCVQTTWFGNRRSWPDHRRQNSFNGCYVCWRFGSFHMEEGIHWPYWADAPSTAGGHTVELATQCHRGALKLGKCFCYLLDYTCNKGVWSYAVHSDFELFINNPDSTKSSIEQEEVSTSKKTLGIYDAPSGENQGHLEYICGKLTMWITRMWNGHIPAHMAWIAYKL